MIFPRLRKNLIFFIAACLFPFIFVKAQSIDFIAHDKFSGDLRQIKELDATLSRDVLESRYGLLSHYDSLVVTVRQIESLQNKSKQVPGFIGAEGKQRIYNLLAKYAEIFSIKNELIEQFKSKNAIVRNSLYYFPILSSELINKAKLQPEEELEVRLNNLLRDVLMYNLTSSEDLAPGIKANISWLAKNRSRYSTDMAEKIDVEIAHVKVILINKPHVDALILKISALPTSERGEELYRAYSQEYEKALNTATFYRFLLFVFSLMAIAAIAAYIIAKMRKSALAVQQAEEKYRSIFENVTEGIFQTTPDGRYLSANRALAHIYGYDSPEEMLEKHADIAGKLYLDANQRDNFIAILQEHNQILNFESQVYRKDGAAIWITQSARTVRDQSGKILYYEGTVSEITKRKQAEIALRYEKEKSEKLLLNILPEPIADRLRHDPNPIADSFPAVTVLFADIVGFTKLSAEVEPQELVVLLNNIFSTFDNLASLHGLEKIKTIGDAYMVVGGLPIERPDHAEAIAQIALDMQDAIAQFNTQMGQNLSIRIGIHTGPVVAGVIGLKKFIYDLWGDTVNTASRMESHGLPGCIQVTDATYMLLKHNYLFEERGIIQVKGKGNMTTYFLTGRKTCYLA